MIKLFNVYYPTRLVMLFLFEGFLVSLCFLIASFIELGHSTLIVLTFEHGVAKILGTSVLTLAFSYYFDLYEPQLVSGRYAIYFRVFLVLGFDCFTVSAILFFFPTFAIGSEKVYFLGFVLLLPALIGCRRAYEGMISKHLFRERVFVIGTGEMARTIVGMIRARPDSGFEVDDFADLGVPPSERKVIWRQKLHDLEFPHIQISRIIIAMESPRGELPSQELVNLRFKGIKIETAAALYERLTGKLQLDSLRPSDFLYAEGFRLKPSQQFTRQVISTLAAAVGLLLVVPFFPIIILLVQFSSKGPIFFRQTRVGASGRTFEVVKFRSMGTDAEDSGAQWATKNDPRVTRFGMFMRKTRIDELPQLWNVLCGDMGFVGPRPERPEFIPMLVRELPFYELRHLIRPGLTGWAQVRYGYGSTLAESREKLAHDLYYIKHMSLGLDLFIMFETIKTVVRRRGSQ